MYMNPPYQKLSGRVGCKTLSPPFLFLALEGIGRLHGLPVTNFCVGIIFFHIYNCMLSLKLCIKYTQMAIYCIAGKFGEHYKIIWQISQKNTICESLIWRLCYCRWMARLILAVLILAFCPKFTKSSNPP